MFAKVNLSHADLKSYSYINQQKGLSVEKDNLVIHGVTEEGKKLRPSDWIERISSSLAGFCEQKKLKYCASVQPCIVEGEKCLVVARELEAVDPAAFEFVMSFARSNQLKIMADRRQGDRALQLE